MGKKFYLLVLLLIVLLTINVNAESYYTNNSGVEMSEQQYHNLKKVMTEEYLSNISQDEFNRIINSKVISSSTIYQKIVTKDGNEVLAQNITEEEYNNPPIVKRTPQWSDEISTNYKTLHATLFQTNNGYHILATLHWKKKPATTSYDIFAFWSNNFSYSNVAGTQTYYTNGGSKSISYSSSSRGYKGLSNGAGISMNLTDGGNITSYGCAISADLKVKNSNVVSYMYISYQHSKHNITRSDSKQYTLGIQGLGNVVYFANASLRGTYDGMDGVRVNL